MGELSLWDPWESMERMRRHWLDKPEFGRGIIREPLVDVVDKGNRYEVCAELPGIEKKDIDINVLPNSVAIGAEQKTTVTEERKKQGYYFHERSYQQFYRRIPLAEEVMPESACAEFKNGVLALTVKKKRAKAKKPKGHRVKVK